MTPSDDLARETALELITADTRFFLRLALDPSLEPVRPVAALALMPFLSAFVYESARYIQDPSVTYLLASHQSLLSTSRLRMKLLEDRYRSSAEVLANTTELAALVSRWFLESRGRLRWIKRRFQSDLGLFFINGEIICTTHVGFVNLGLTKEDLAQGDLSLDTLGPHLGDRMVDVGKYVNLLSGLLDIDPTDVPESIPSNVSPISYRDIKSRHFYERAAARAAPGNTSIVLLLTSILSQVSTARLLAPKIDPSNELAEWKIRFISLYHAILSLRRLLDDHRQDLHPDAIDSFDGLVNDEVIRQISDYRILRNNLIHYRIDSRVVNRLSRDLPLSGLVEASTGGDSFEMLRKHIDRELLRVVNAIASVFPHASPQDSL